MKLFRQALTFFVVIVCIFFSAIPAVRATDIPLLGFFSYEEYRSFLKETKLPEDFVTFSDLSHFGEFDGFVRLCSPLDDYSSYMYDFIDELDYKFVIYVDRVYETPEYIDKYPLVDASQINLTDMRTLPSGGNGRYVISDITYWYISGKLSSIRWYQNGMYFSLSLFEPSLSEYPLDADTPVAKMLNIRDKSEKELKAVLHGTQISPWIYVSVVAVLVITSSVTIFLYKCRKKQCCPPEQQ